MEPLTKEKLAANAYRTLGLSASASQATIEIAARRMRIWPDPMRIPPTPWDMTDLLGGVSRSRVEIERAVAVLNEPQSRVEERLLWYQGDQPPAGNKVDLNQPATTDVSRSPIQEQGAALAALHRAYQSDPDLSNLPAWKGAIDGWMTLARSQTYAQWLARVEEQGDFEKRASSDEINAAIGSLTPALTSALIPRIQAAIARGGADAAGLSDLLRCADSPVAPSTSVENLLDSLEDALLGDCRAIQADLSEALLINHHHPYPFYARNSEASTKAATAYNATVAPALKEFCVLAGADESRLMRVKSTCAGVLGVLGIGWEWSGQFITAEQTLLMALDLAEGSAAAIGIQKDLERCAARAEQQRIETRGNIIEDWDLSGGGSEGTLSHDRLAPPPAVRLARKPKAPVKLNRAWVIALGVLAVKLISGIGQWSTSNPPNYSPSPPANYNIDDDLTRELARFRSTGAPSIPGADSPPNPNLSPTAVRNIFSGRPTLLTTRPANKPGDTHRGH